MNLQTKADFTALMHKFLDPTTITPTKTGHRRHHEIDSAYDCEAYDCGFAAPNFAPGYEENAIGEWAEAHCSGLSCIVRGESGKGIVIGCDPNTSLYFNSVHLPAVYFAIPQGHSVIDSEIIDNAE